jgi:hypothetical protein
VLRQTFPRADGICSQHARLVSRSSGAGQVPGFLALYEIEVELSKLLGGRKVDLVTERSLNRRLRDHVLSSAESSMQPDDGGPSPLFEEPHPEKAIEAPELGSLRSEAEQGKLLPQRQILERGVGAGSERRAQGAQQSRG